MRLHVFKQHFKTSTRKYLLDLPFLTNPISLMQQLKCDVTFDLTSSEIVQKTRSILNYSLIFAIKVTSNITPHLAIVTVRSFWLEKPRAGEHASEQIWGGIFVACQASQT